MPLSRYLVRNEYGLADPDLYRIADKDDPEALLEGVAMAGLVGVLRQLGDLAEFAAEMFHDLHEEVMATAARGHALIARVQQLEAEFPSVEKTFLSQTSHTPFLYNSGIDWHPNIRMDENLVTQGDMPRFVMDSYEECRGPPRLFLLDKFDVAGAGACLKRYTDPSFFKAESADSSIKKSEGPREKRIRKVKKRGPRWRNGDTSEVFPSSHAKLHQLLLEERIETGGNDPERRVKLKKRPLDGFQRCEKLGSYMQKFLETCSPEYKVVHEVSLDLVPLNLESNIDSCQTGLEIVEIGTVSPSQEPYYRDKMTYSSLSTPEVVKSSVNEYNELIDGENAEIPGSNYEADTDKLALLDKDVNDDELAADTGSKSEGSVGEYNTDDIASEIDNYVDALATMESEVETESDCRTRRDLRYPNSGKKMMDSDGSEEQQERQNTFLDYHSVGNSTVSDDGSLLKKDVDSFSCSDNVSNFAESTLDGAGEATAKSSTAGSMNHLADDEKSVIEEAQGNKLKEYVTSDAAESMRKKSLVKAELTEIPWNSVRVGTASTKIGKKWIEQTDRFILESKEQALLQDGSNDGYDRPMPSGKPPVDDMADAGSDASVDVLLNHSHMPDETLTHSQSQYANVVQSTLSSEMSSSPASSPAAMPINDLRQPIEEASSDGLSVLQKPSVSGLNHTEPVFLACEDGNLTPTIEEKSEDQPHLLAVEQNHEQPEGPTCCGDETNIIGMVSLAADGAELVESMISVATDDDGMVESSALKAANSKDLSTSVVDHADGECPAMEIHYAPEPLCLGKTESTGRPELSSPEIKLAHSVDDYSDKTVCESTVELTGKTTMSADDDSNFNLLVNSSQIQSQSDHVSKTTDVPVLFDGQVNGAGNLASATVADMDGSTKSIHFDEVESVEATKNQNDCLAMYLDQPGPAPVCSSHPHLVDDASETSPEEGAAISFHDINDGMDATISSETISADFHSEHLPEGKNGLDMDHSVRELEHSETKVASARHNCLMVENAETERQPLSSVFYSSSMWYTNKQHEECLSIGEDPYQNSNGNQMQSLQRHAEMALQNPVSPRRDDCVTSDSIVCDNSKETSVLRLADDVHDNCLADGSQASLYPTIPEEAPLSSTEYDQHLERTNSSCYQDVEDKEHDLDALANVPTKSQIALDKAIETQDVETIVDSSNRMEGTSQPLEFVDLDALANVHTKSQFSLDKAIETQDVVPTVESFKGIEGTSKPLGYADQILPPEDSGNEMCINLTTVFSFSAPLSRPFAGDVSVQSGEYKLGTQPVEGEPLICSGSVLSPRESLVAEVSALSADDKLESTRQAMEQSPAALSSSSLLPDETQASLKIENPGQTMDRSQMSLPLFGTFPDPNHIKPGEMPPLPPLPPMQWRLGRNQHASLASEGPMRHSLGITQRLNPPKTSDNAVLKSQNAAGAQHLNPFLSLSDEGASFQHADGYSSDSLQQPISSLLSMPNMVHERGQQHTINVDQKQVAQICTGSQDDLPASDTEMEKFSLGPLESGLMSEGATSGHTPASIEEVIQKKTAVADEQLKHTSLAEEEAATVDEQLEHALSPAEQETAAVDELPEHTSSSAEQEIAAVDEQLEHALSPAEQEIAAVDEQLKHTSSLADQEIAAVDEQLEHASSPAEQEIVAVDEQLEHTPSLAEQEIASVDEQLEHTSSLAEQEIASVDEQLEHTLSPAEQETAVVDEQLEHVTQKEIATAPAQFEQLVAMQYGQQLPLVFMAPEAQGIWSPNIFGTIRTESVNGVVQKKIPRPRNPLIDAVALGKSKLRKVGDVVKPQDKPEVEKIDQHLPQLRKVGERVKLQDSVKAEESFQNFPPLRKIGERVKPQDLPTTEDSAQHLPQLRKVVEKNVSQDGQTAEENNLHLPQLRKVGERIKHQDRPTTEENTQQLLQLRKVDEKIKPQDESKAEERKESFLPPRGVGGKLKPQDGPQAEDRDSLLEQIRNKSFNLKPAATGRPSVQGPQTNLKVAAMLEKASTIRQAVAGSDEDDSDGWSDN